MRGISLPFINYPCVLCILERSLSCFLSALRLFPFLVVAPMHGFAFWFDVEFSGPAASPAKNTNATSVASGSSSMSPSGEGREGNQKKRTNPSDALVLSTAPEAPPTHWQQVRPCFFIYFPISLKFLSVLLFS